MADSKLDKQPLEDKHPENADVEDRDIDEQQTLDDLTVLTDGETHETKAQQVSETSDEIDRIDEVLGTIHLGSRQTDNQIMADLPKRPVLDEEEIPSPATSQHEEINVPISPTTGARGESRDLDLSGLPPANLSQRPESPPPSDGSPVLSPLKERLPSVNVPDQHAPRSIETQESIATNTELEQAGLVNIRPEGFETEFLAMVTQPNLNLPNFDPVARPDVVSTYEDSGITFNVLANDTDIDGTMLTITEASMSGDVDGTLTINQNGNITFVPGRSFIFLSNGETQEVTIDYTISDGEGGTATTTATVTVFGTGSTIDFPLSIEDEAPAEITISGVPAGVIFSAGIQNLDGSWVFSSDEIDGLRMAINTHIAEPFDLAVTSWGKSGNESTSAATSMDFSIDSQGEWMTPETLTLIGGTQKGDIISGTDGADLIAGYGNDDTIAGGDGDDTVYGHGGRDEISGEAGDDTLVGGSGNDTLTGGDGKDLLIGEKGKDELYGGDDDDTLYGGTQDDKLFGDQGDDTLYGGAGKDKLYGGEGDDTLVGGAGRDTLDGGPGDDVLDGGEGRNTLYGGQGDDVFMAGEGDDTAYGNAGNDLFIFGPNSGNDTFIGGDGGWANAVQLEGTTGSFGDNANWTLDVSEDVEFSETDEGIYFTENASGSIIFDDGSELDFEDISEITW